MARSKVKKSNVNDQDLRNDRFFRKQVLSIDNMIGQSSLSLYGTDRSSEVDTLNQQFQDILNNKINFTKKKTACLLLNNYKYFLRSFFL